MDNKQKTINKFKTLSDKYHKMSLLFYELSESLKIETKNMSFKEFKEYLKNDLNLDFEKIEKITKGVSDLEFKDIMKNEKDIEN